MLGVGLFLLFVCIAGGYAYFRVAGSKDKWRAAENCLVAAKMFGELIDGDKLRINALVVRRVRQMGLSSDKNEIARMLNENNIARGLLYARVFSESGMLPNAFIDRWGWMKEFKPFKTLSETDREYKFTVSKFEKATGQKASLNMGTFVVPD